MNDLISSVISDAEKEAYKKQFEMQNPNGLGYSVNIGGYGNLNFANDDVYKQFQQDPQSMTYSQGPGGVRYVEPKAADYTTQFQGMSQAPSMQPTPRLPQMPNPAMQMMPSSDMQNNFMINDQSMMQGAKSMPEGLLKLIRGL